MQKYLINGYLIYKKTLINRKIRVGDVRANGQALMKDIANYIFLKLVSGYLIYYRNDQ